MTRQGGLPARRAVVTWAARMLRREWRQQLLVLALITVTVAGAILGASAAYSMTPSRDGEFGTADRRLELRASPQLASDLDAIRRWAGPIDVISHRTAAVPGSVETVDVRGQAPDGVFTKPMLALRSGRYPRAAGEVALTDRAAALLTTRVGAAVALDGRRLSVVGVVENPGDLADEFALVAPGHTDAPESVTVLVRASNDDQIVPAELRDRVPVAMRRGSTEKTTGAVVALALATVVLLLIGLVAGAGFVVVAHRRQRQLGMLAAIGATDRQLRLVVVANGALVGMVAGVAGAVIGLLGWVVLAPRLEGGAGHRIATFDVPWWLVATGMLLAVATATAAAWWPARIMARMPITQALSGRPPRPRPTHRSAAVAAVLLAVGFVCLSVGFDNPHDRANPVLVMSGMAAIVVGIMFTSPLAIRVLAVTARHLPVAPRVAVRDLARHQARSGAALSAISLGLGIAVALIVAAAAAAPTSAEGNLSDRQVLVRSSLVGGDVLDKPVPEIGAEELARLQSAVDGFAATLDEPAVLPLDVVVDPTIRETMQGRVVRPPVTLARRVGPNTFRAVDVLYVASPDVLARLGIDPQQIRPGTDVLTSATGELRFVNGVRRDSKPPTPKVQRFDVPAFTSMPRVLITTDGLRRYGWAPARAGWLVESARPLTDKQLTAGRALAAANGADLESRLGQGDLTAIRTGATIGGMLLALGVLAMTVGLIRGEAASDLRTLTATGATTTTRRTLTAATAGALGLLGVVLGIGGAYLALTGGYADDLGALGRPPVPELLVMLVGVPGLAVVAGWFLAGREPAVLSRAALD